MKYPPMHPNGTCPNCGGPLLGDGYETVLHCEFAEIPDCVEPDAQPVFCEPAADVLPRIKL